ncbi:MAG TPA: BatD family protein, partial [Planctomycetota bacterium]|nr:BatD family protein [Planctomycetota bacterium]
ISLVYTIVATPDGEGEFDIPPIRVTVKGRAFETKTAHLTVVRDFRGASLAFLEVVGPKRAIFRGEIFRIDATFGLREDLVQTGVALRAAWADDLHDAVRLEIPSPSPDVAQQIGLNGRAAYVSRIGPVRRGNAGFVAWRLSVPFVASFPGTLSVGKTFFVFERIVRRATGFFDRDEAERMFVDAPAFEIEVKELPDEGRPDGFGGAIGKLQVETDANPRDVKVGESIRLVMRITGEGNLGFLEPPDLERAAGFERFRFFGRLEDKGEGKREVVYDLAPLGEDATTLPSVLFPYFDPDEGAYRTAKTDPIPLRIRPLPPGERLPDLPGAATESAPKDDLRDAKPALTVRPRAEDLSPAAAVAALLPPLAWFGALALRQRRLRRERDPAGWRRRRAAAAFRERVAALRPRVETGDPREACAEIARAVASYLADREGSAA